jgi:hypothetical protein
VTPGHWVRDPLPGARIGLTRRCAGAVAVQVGKAVEERLDLADARERVGDEAGGGNLAARRAGERAGNGEAACGVGQGRGRL